MLGAGGRGGKGAALPGAVSQGCGGGRGPVSHPGDRAGGGIRRPRRGERRLRFAQGYEAPAVERTYFFTREGDANGADVSLVLEGEEEHLVRCNHGNGPAPDHVCESAWLDGTLYQGADCLTAMFGEGALDAAAD